MGDWGLLGGGRAALGLRKPSVLSASGVHWGSVSLIPLLSLMAAAPAGPEDIPEGNLGRIPGLPPAWVLGPRGL